MIRNYSLEYPTPFVGRTKELAEITARFENPDCRLLTLTGLGGSGKTRLALEAAKTLAPHFPDGIVFVGLQPLNKSDLLVPTIAHALGITFYGAGDPQAQLLRYFREKSLLLLLDNFEHLLDGAALVSDLLAQAPAVKVLVTSREALNLKQEWLYPLTGMDTPSSVYQASLESYDAVQLFLYHAHRMQPDFDLADELDAVIRICRTAEGLPLAIELAASWLKGLSVEQIATEMQRNLDFLATTARNVEERHRSVRAAFDQSWKLLSEDERLIFAKLSVFRGGFDREAAEQITGTTLPMLVALVEKSLVQMASFDRFGIHELLCQYGTEKLEAYGQTEATYAQFSQHFARRMLRYDSVLKQPEQLEALAAIDNDFENIRQAWDWSVRNQQAAHLHAMLNALYLFGFLRSRYREIIAIFEHGLEQPTDDPTLSSRLLVRRWGYLHWLRQGDYREALSIIEQALTIAHAQNDSFEIAFCHLAAAFALIGVHQYTEALPHLETSQPLFEAVNEPYYVTWVLHRRGYCYYNLNEPDKANQYTEQSLALARVTHNRASLVACLLNLGSHALLNSDYAKGKSHCEEALQVATESGHQGQLAHALSLLALCAFFQGDYAACQDYAQRSRTINETIRPQVFQPYNQSLLILLACLREDYAEGVRESETGERLTIDKMGFQLLYWSLAALSCGLGRPAETRLTIEKLFQVSDPDINSVTTIWIVPSVVYLLSETDPEKALELLAWVFSYADLALNWVRQWPLFERLQAQLQASIDIETYQKHWDKGQSLSLDAVRTFLYQEFRPSSDSAESQLLTARESEILRLMAAGMTNPQIAQQLVIGAGTVKSHTLSIYRKLEVANRSQAILRAQELRLLHA